MLKLSDGLGWSLSDTLDDLAGSSSNTLDNLDGSPLDKDPGGKKISKICPSLQFVSGLSWEELMVSAGLSRDIADKETEEEKLKFFKVSKSSEGIS